MSGEESFNIKLNIWSGPLDLLLDLIRNSKINIYDIPINEITKQYLEAIEIMEKINIDIASDFLVMASRLIYIKSKMLLPVEYQEEDNPFEVDLQKELIEELLEYQKFKNVSSLIEDRQDHQKYIVERKDKQTTFTPYIHQRDLWQEIELLDVIKVFYEIIDDIDKKQLELETIRNETFSLEDKINIIKEILNEEGQINFYDLFSTKNLVKEEIIVTFWAILELYKQSFISLKQHTLFSDIYIFKREQKENTA